MADENSLERRRFLAMGGSVLGSTVLGGCQTLKRRYPPLSIEITLTEGLADRAEEERNSRTYPAERMAEFARTSLKTLLPQNIADNLEIVYNSQEPGIGSTMAEEALYTWIEESGSNHASKLLITDDKFHEAVGLGDIGSDPVESNCAVLGEGYDLLKLDECEWREKVLVSEYVWDELSYEINYTSLKTAIAGIHEIGHNLGLEHGDGEVYEAEDGIELSTMAASYLDRYSESVDIRLSDCIYWSPEFSGSAEERMKDLL